MVKNKKLFVVAISIILLLFFPATKRIIGQQNATVTVNATINTVLVFEVDGTDADNTYAAAETVDYGTVDPDGTATVGGDFAGLAGTPYGGPPTVGAYYDVYAANGGNDHNGHANAALGIHVKSNKLWDLDVTAALVGDASVTIGQLFWQDDSSPGWTAFTAASQNIYTNHARGNNYEFHDYRLQVEYTDEPGAYTWTLTYTVTQVP